MSFQIAAIKVAAAQMACRVIDRAIQVSPQGVHIMNNVLIRCVNTQVHGAEGVCQDSPLPHWFAGARSLRIADGPDIVHLETVAKMEMKQQSKL